MIHKLTLDNITRLKDKKQFFKFYKILRGHPDEKLSKITDHVFRCFDKDSNGYLDFSGIISINLIILSKNIFTLRKKLEFIIAYSSTTKSDPTKKVIFYV